MNISLYIHIPFCNSKCPYCDFYSIVPDVEALKENYLDALKREIIIYSQKYPQINIQSIYIGGGTPTVLKGQQIFEIIQTCFDKFNVNKEIEVTIESNPESFNYDKAQNIFESGINRISIGAQSFNNKLLESIGRIHDKHAIIKSYQIARDIGFNNINIDLMFGLPGQSVIQFMKTLDKAILLHPEHISIYSLSVEPKTIFSKLFKKGTLNIPSDDIVYEMYKNAITILQDNEYEQYEISNFSIQKKECFHNIRYWKNCPYLGVGASAVSYIEKNRYKNISDVNKYTYFLKHNILPVETKEVLPLKEEMSETVILNLRMMEGIAKQDFINRFNVPIESIFGKQLSYLKENKLIESNDSHYFLTERGIFISNTVFVEFLN